MYLNLSIIISFSSYWPLLFIIPISLGIGYWMYYLPKSSQLPTWIRTLLFILRSLTIFLLLILLLSPIIQIQYNREIKPSALLLFDNSLSTKNFQSQIESKFQPMLNSFDNLLIYDLSSKKEKLTDIKFNLPETDLSSALSKAFGDISDYQNVRDIYLVTDGNYNEGINPTYISNPAGIKINTVLLGDTTHFGDFSIENIDYNQVVLTDQDNPIKVSINASNTISRSATVQLFAIQDNKSVLQSQKTINVKPGFSSETIDFNIHKNQPGKFHYQVVISKDPSERVIANNSKNFFIEVISDKKKLLLVYSSPHPDISAIKSILETNNKFELKTQQVQSFIKPTDKKDLVIFYQFPNSYTWSSQWIDWVQESKTSSWFILGSQVNYSKWNQSYSNFTIDPQGNFYQDFFPTYNTKFSSFLLEKSTIDLIPKLPPLSNKMVKVNTPKLLETVMNTRIANVNTQMPLLSFTEHKGQKMGVLLGENIWKWKLTDYQLNNSWKNISDLIFNTVNYLAVHSAQKQLVTSVSKDIYKLNEQVSINATTYNEVYQPVNADKITCELIGPNKKISQEMIPQDNKYIFKPNNLTSGDYNYSVTAIINGKTFKESGSFSVSDEILENALLRSNFEDMQALSQANQGEIQLLSNFNSIKKYNTNETKIVKESLSDSVINKVGVLIFILILLTLEWVIRKYFSQL